jgi:tetratricopeptide (TPR) repeat protein
MNRAHDCKQMSEQLFDYRRAELSALDAAQFEEALEQCPVCAQRAGRLIGLLDLAAEAPAEDWLDEPGEDALGDALFASISQRLEAITVAPQAEEREVRLRGPMAELAAPSNDDEEDEPLASPRRLTPWLALAACAALAVGAAFMLKGADVQTPVTEPAPVASKDDALPALAPVASAQQAVKVFASDGATWTLDREGSGYVVHLRGGTLLIEFLPTVAGESLRVETQDTRIDVVGTVFFVRAEAKPAQEEVGVLAGSVRVKHAGQGGDKLLKPGQGMEASGDVRALEPATFEQVRPLVDLQAHNAALAARAASAQEVVSPRKPAPQAVEREVVKRDVPVVREVAKPAPQPRVESAGELRQRATDALAARQYAQAAQDYERLLTRTPAGTPEAATLRLELARIYMRELNQREQAIGHLRAFIKDHPDDVAAPSARRQLCRLGGADDIDCHQ